MHSQPSHEPDDIETAAYVKVYHVQLLTVISISLTPAAASDAVVLEEAPLQTGGYRDVLNQLIRVLIVNGPFINSTRRVVTLRLVVKSTSQVSL